MLSHYVVQDFFYIDIITAITNKYLRHIRLHCQKSFVTRHVQFCMIDYECYPNNFLEFYNYQYISINN